MVCRNGSCISDAFYVVNLVFSVGAVKSARLEPDHPVQTGGIGGEICRLRPDRVPGGAVLSAVRADADVAQLGADVAAGACGRGSQRRHLVPDDLHVGRPSVQRGKFAGRLDRVGVLDGLLHRQNKRLGGDDGTVGFVPLINADFALIAPDLLRHAAGQQKGHNAAAVVVLGNLAGHESDGRVASLALDVKRRRAACQVKQTVARVNIVDSDVQKTAVVVELLDGDRVNRRVDVDFSRNIILHIFQNTSLTHGESVALRAGRAAELSCGTAVGRPRARNIKINRDGVPGSVPRESQRSRMRGNARPDGG